MTRLKFLVLLLFFVFWFSMLGVQMFAEFLDIESLNLLVERLRRRAFTLRTRFNCFSYYIALYFFVLLGSSKKEKMPTLEKRRKNYNDKNPC